MVRRARKSLVTPPERLRVGPFRPNAFSSRLHSERVAAVLGMALGVAFTLCFITGVLAISFKTHPGGSRGRRDPPASTGSTRASM